MTEMKAEPKPKLQSRGFFMGVDLGQTRDYTAIVVVEQLIPSSSDNNSLDEYHVRHCERLPLGTNYEAVTQHIKGLITRASTQNPNNGITLICDATGVGRPIIDAMRGDGLTPVPVTVHGGDNTTKDKGEWHVPKRDLVAVPKVLLGKGQFKIGEGIPFADVLISELRNFQVKVNIAGHDVYEAWREGDHDDLVFAASLACWYAFEQKRKNEHFRGTVVIRGTIRRRERMY